MFKPVLAAAAAALMTIAASGASAAPIFATEVVEYSPAQTLPTGRDDPSRILGAPDRRYVSLGGGPIVVNIGRPFTGMFQIYEVTGTYHTNWNETASIYGVANGTDTLLGTMNNTMNVWTFTTNLIFDALKIVDTTPLTYPNTPAQRSGGIDIDAVALTPVPLAPSLLLLGGALAGFGALRGRRKAA
jgi:hypothetical protein